MNEDKQVIVKCEVNEDKKPSPKYSRLLNKRKISSNNIDEIQYFDNIFWKSSNQNIESIDISGLLIDN